MGATTVDSEQRARRKIVARKQPGRPKKTRKKVSLQLYVDPELKAALEEDIASIRPATDMTALMTMLAEDYLRSKGRWPRTPKPAPSGEGGD